MIIVVQVRVCFCAHEAGHYLQSWQVDFHSVDADAVCLHTCGIDTISIVSCTATEYHWFHICSVLVSNVAHIAPNHDITTVLNSLKS